MSESDVCYIIICCAESLLPLLEAGKRLSPERLIELKEEGRSVSMSAFDDDLVAANKDSGGMLTHAPTHEENKLTLAETRVKVGEASSSKSANTAGFLIEVERFILMLIVVVVGIYEFNSMSTHCSTSAAR